MHKLVFNCVIFLRNKEEACFRFGSGLVANELLQGLGPRWYHNCVEEDVYVERDDVHHMAWIVLHQLCWILCGSVHIYMEKVVLGLL